MEVGSGSSLGLDSLGRLESGQQDPGRLLFSRVQAQTRRELADRSGSMHCVCFLVLMRIKCVIDSHYWTAL